MNTNVTNQCTEHDWTASAWEPGMEVCAWGCGATREAPLRVDAPSDTLVAAVQAAREAA